MQARGVPRPNAHDAQGTTQDAFHHLAQSSPRSDEPGRQLGQCKTSLLGGPALFHTCKLVPGASDSSFEVALLIQLIYATNIVQQHATNAL